MAKETKPVDAIEAIIEQIKKIQEKIDRMEGQDTTDLEERLAGLESRLNVNPNFGSWD